MPLKLYGPAAIGDDTVIPDPNTPEGRKLIESTTGTKQTTVQDAVTNAFKQLGIDNLLSFAVVAGIAYLILKRR